jgi:vacuolar protein sorting-associated protein 45
MVASCAENFLPSIYNPPSGIPASSAATPTPGHSSATTPAPYAGAGGPRADGPAINLRAEGYELSVGGSGGSGVFRTGQDSGATFQIGGGAQQVAEGIMDGAGRLWGNVRQRVEERVSRSATPQGR